MASIYSVEKVRGTGVRTEIVRTSVTSYTVSTFERVFHVGGLKDESELFSCYNEILLTTGITLGEKGPKQTQGVAPMRVRRIQASMFDPTCALLTFTYSDDPRQEPAYPAGFPDIHAMWESDIRMFSRQTYVDKDGNKLIVARPIDFDPANEALVTANTKPASASQMLPQEVLVIEYGVDVDTLSKILAGKGCINDGKFLGYDKGMLLCTGITSRVALFQDIANSEPAIPMDTVYMVRIQLLSAGPPGVMTQVLGEPVPAKEGWEQLCYYAEGGGTDRIPRDKNGKLKNAKSAESDDRAQELIVAPYDYFDFTTFGPEDFGEQASNVQGF